MWEDGFHSYLSIERKLSENESSLSANKARFKKIANWFSEKNLAFNRNNFRIFVQELLDAGYKPSYRNGLITMSKHIDKYLDINEIQDFTLFNDERNIDYEPLTYDEITKIAYAPITYAKEGWYLNRRNRVFYLILGLIGARPGEMLNLKWEDVHQSTNTYYITFKNTKTNRMRKIPIGTNLGKLLEDLPKMGEYVFMSYRGKKLRSQEIGLDLKRRAELAGIKKPVWLYLFRHSVPIELLSDGVELSDVSDLLGHVDPRTTMRYKHADLNHYLDAIMAHPMLKDEMNWEMQTKRIEERLPKMVSGKFKLDISAGEEKITITVQNTEAKKH